MKTIFNGIFFIYWGYRVCQTDLYYTKTQKIPFIQILN